MLKYVFWSVLIGGSTGLYSQSPEVDQPAYSHGPFHATDQTVWSLFRNMAGLSTSDDPELALGYQIPFNQSDLQSLALGIIIPSKPTLGFSYYRAGSEAFINQQLGFNTAISLHGFDFGLRIKYWNASISGLKPLHAISLDGGLQLQISNQLLVGIFVSNLTQSKLNREEVLPITWYNGLKYSASQKLAVMVEFGQVMGSRWQFSVGIEYIIKEKLFARTSFNLPSGRGYFGLGFKLNQLSVDYAIDLHPHLGITQQAGISFSWT